ncbi:GmrSD restriction endonuclease domain-containing protein [Sphingomonas solaris]|nr:DUF262 domain-containing protein [Sphingomonas solaris]
MTIAEALNRINQSLFLPAIQRPYVWKPEAIIELFDSLMQGYPISSFLFWEVEPENRRRWAIYKFQEQHRQGESWNETVQPDGRSVVFVLDGQQRLTSLLIGLRGSYTQRERYGRREKATSYRAHHLYLDLFKDPADIDEDEEITANRYAFRFSDVAPRNDAKHLWMKIGDILDLEAGDRLTAYRDQLLGAVHERVTAAQLEIAEQSLGRLHDLVWREQPISYYTEHLQDLDRVLSVFIRANEGGTKLSKSDLLMAVIETTWGESYVREEILGLVKRLNRDMGREFAFDKDTVMRACLVIPDLPVVYNVANFTAHNMAVIRQSWSLIRSSLEAAVALAARFGLDASLLSSTNAIIPIAYYISRLGGHPLDGTSAFDVVNRERIRRWLFSSLFNGAFGGNSDQTMALCREVIRNELRTSRDFPLQRLADDMRTRRSRPIAFDDQGVRKLLDVNYGQRHCYLALAMLYDGQTSRTARYHVDHIIPQALLSEKVLRERGVPGAKIERIRAAANRIGNLQLLVDHDNLGKSDTAFETWLKTRDPAYLEQHMIPDDAELWHPEALLEFIDAREDLMRAALRRFLIIEDRSPPPNRAAA